jgi:hypothetical protein
VCLQLHMWWCVKDPSSGSAAWTSLDIQPGGEGDRRCAEEPDAIWYCGPEQHKQVICANPGLNSSWTCPGHMRMRNVIIGRWCSQYGCHRQKCNTMLHLCPLPRLSQWLCTALT